MKRLLSIVLTAMMLISVLPAASALTMVDVIGDWLVNPVELELGLSVGGRASGTNNAYAPNTSLRISRNPSPNPVGADYKATLDMTNVRAFFEEEFISLVLPNDDEFKNEFEAGTVTTNIDVELTFPAGSVKDGVDLTNAATGVLKVNDSTETIYTESSARVLTDNTLKFSFANVPTTVADLLADVDGKLGDITFEIEDAFVYDTAADYQMEVKFSGSTVLDFATKDHTFIYNEVIASHTTSVVVSSGGGSSIHSIIFNANGGSDVKSINVSDGSTIKAPVTTKEGFKFDGWYEDREFTKLFDFSTPIESDITLYAKWVEEGEGDTTWFVDVPENAWFYDEIKYAYDNGIMNGISDTHFEPDAAVTRAMFVTVLYRIEKEPEVTASTFIDVLGGSWYDEAVAWATENGITNGVSETEFAPNANILREQIAAMLYRYAQFKGYDVSLEGESKVPSYADAAKVSEYAVPAFTWAVGDGILNGKSESILAPKDNATRAEAAALLMRMIEKYSK